jgi:superfamily II DNA or RNA helicase
MHLVIRRSGTLIEISPDGQTPLPAPIVACLHPYLQYDHRHLLRGAAAYDSVTGHRESVEIVTKLMYRLEGGRLVTGFGFLPRIVNLLRAQGHIVHFVDISPPRRRPNCYETNWEGLAQAGLQFRPRQLECLLAIANNPGGVIVAPTGFGKTMLLCMLALLYPRAKIAIVTRSVEVAETIVRRLSAYLPSVGMVGGGRAITGRVTVYTAGSMHHCDGDADIFLADEIHQLMSDDSSETMGATFRHTRNYGFTATPEGRMDGACAMLEMFFGPRIFQMTYDEAVSLGLVVPIFVRWLPVCLTDNPAAGKKDVPKLRWGIWRNQARNALIAADARQYPEDTQILINVSTIDHAIHLWQYLPEFELCYASFDPEECHRYQRNKLLPQDFRIVTPERRYQMQRDFERKALKRVIATDVWSTGVDFEQLQVFYNISGRESEILNTQGPGRVSRTFDGKDCGEVVDCIDFFDSGFKRKSELRRRQYKSLGWADNWPTGRRQANRS